MSYVSTAPPSDARALEEEAREVFELFRPTAELWGFDRAEMTSRPTLEWRGEMTIYRCERAPGGAWTIAKWH